MPSEHTHTQTTTTTTTTPHHPIVKYFFEIFTKIIIKSAMFFSSNKLYFHYECTDDNSILGHSLIHGLVYMVLKHVHANFCRAKLLF